MVNVHGAVEVILQNIVVRVPRELVSLRGEANIAKWSDELMNEVKAVELGEDNAVVWTARGVTLRIEVIIRGVQHVHGIIIAKEWPKRAQYLRHCVACCTLLIPSEMP